MAEYGEHEATDDPLQVLLPRRHRAAGDQVRLAALRDERWVAPLAVTGGLTAVLALAD